MTNNQNKLLYQIALTQINGVGDRTARLLLQAVGNEEALFRSSRKPLLSINGIAGKTVDEILNPDVLRKAEKELLFIEKNKIQTYFVNDENYPSRLRDYTDAPILLYFKGNTDFNTQRVISIVGTRNSSYYGNNFCDSFLEELASALPHTLIVSGLAYGIDINAHRAALKHKLPTIGVLAHGLDRIYPSAHRQTAIEMMEGGGLLTEFTSGTEPDKFNFVRRNRIVAGIADAVIVVESNTKGGSLITAEIANSYCKDVFAVPGKTTDPKSNGCNKLIAEHKADLFLSTEYFISQMGWDTQSQKTEPKQQRLFTDLSEQETLVVNILTQNSNLHIDLLAKESEIPIYQLLPILLDLELKGVIKNLPGNVYTLG